MRPVRHLLLAVLALAVLAGAPAASAGKPVGFAESFPTKCNVESVAATADGGAWFACTEYSVGKHGSVHSRATAGHVTAAGQVTGFAGPTPVESAPGRNAPGVVAADGSFWFPVEKSFQAIIDYVKTVVPPSLARVMPGGGITLFPVPGPITELAALPDGSLRFKGATGTGGQPLAVFQVTQAGAITATGDDPKLPVAGPSPFPISPTVPSGGIYTPGVVGADGNLWFGIQSGGSIGRLTPTGELTEFRECLRYGQPFFGPETLVRGVEGNIWFTSLAERSLPNIVDPASIGMVTPAGAITQFYAGVKVEPKTIAADSEGGAWFAGGLEEVQRIRPPQGVVNTFHIGKLEKVRASGSALLTVKVPGPGQLQAKPVAVVIGEHSKKAKRIAFNAPTGTATTNVCGSPTVKIQLAGEALRRLKKDRRVQVAVAVTFTPTGGYPYTENKNFFLKLPHHQ